MKRLVSLFLCLSLSIFTMARAMKPSHTLAAIAKTAQKEVTGQKADAKTLLDDASKALAEADEQEVAAEEDTGEKVTSSGTDSMEDASDDEGEDMSDDEASDDDNGGDDDGGDDDGGDDGGDEGGGHDGD
jgi:hypothetical protein